MKQKIDFRSRLLSNDTEGQHDFMPSDKLWGAIELKLYQSQAVSQNKSKKLFWIFISIFFFILLPFIYSLTVSYHTKNIEPSQKSKVNIKKPTVINIPTKSVKEQSLESNTGSVNSGSFKYKQEYLKTDESKTISSDFSVENPLWRDLNENTENSFFINSDIHKAPNSIYDVDAAINENSKTKESKPKEETSLNKPSYYNLEGITNNFQVQDLAGKGSRSGKDIIIDDLPIQSKLNSKYRPIINVGIINSLFPKNVSTDELNKVLSPLPNLINLKPSATETESVFIGFGAIGLNSLVDINSIGEPLDFNFDIDGEQSFGVEMYLQKSISNRLKINTGISISNIRLRSQYKMNLDIDDSFSFILPTGRKNLSYTKVIPTLSGNVKSILSIDSDPDASGSFDMNLLMAHQYYLVDIPLTLSYQIIRNSRHELLLSSGILLSNVAGDLSTELNSLNFSNANLDLRNIDMNPTEIETENLNRNFLSIPFSVEYYCHLSSRSSVGLSFSYSKPLADLYSDQNHIVFSTMVRSGLSIRYALD